MGLLDILNSIQTGGAVPSDARERPSSGPLPAPATDGDSKSMSPIAKALLALLAFYALTHMKREGSTTGGAGSAAPADSSSGGGLGDLLGGILGGGGKGAGASAGGGLGDLLRGPLGGILGGAAAGTIVSGGLGDLLKRFQESGQADTARSWIDNGPNKSITKEDIAGALGSDTINKLTAETGMKRDELLAGLSHYLPGFIDKLTPNGRVPTPEEASRLV